MTADLMPDSGVRKAAFPVRAGRRAKALASRVIYSTVGDWLHALRTPYMLEHRPDFHRFDADFQEFNVLRKGWVKGHTANNGGDISRFYMLYLNIKNVLDAGISGELFELGVYKGNSAFMLAHFARKYDRTLYLFDTFQGFDSRDFQGEDQNQAVLFADTSLAAVRSHVGDEAVVYVPGFYPDSARNLVLPDQIAVAHIDCDLYEPMKAALEGFYPRLSPGGVLIMHDYSSGHWPGAKRAVDEFFADKPEKPILMPDKSGSAVVRKHSDPSEKSLGGRDKLPSTGR